MVKNAANDIIWLLQFPFQVIDLCMSTVVCPLGADKVWLKTQETLSKRRLADSNYNQVDDNQ